MSSQFPTNNPHKPHYKPPPFSLLSVVVAPCRLKKYPSQRMIPPESAAGAAANDDDVGGAMVGSAVVLNLSVDDFVSVAPSCVNPLFSAAPPATNKDGAATKALPDSTATKTGSLPSATMVGVIPRILRRKRRPVAVAAAATSTVPNKSNADSQEEPNSAVVATTDTKGGGLDQKETGHSFTNKNAVPSVSQTTATNSSSSSSNRTVPTTTPTANRSNSNSNSNNSIIPAATMADCLACSGCVTTAETVLVSEQHSLTKLREILFCGGDRSSTAPPSSSSATTDQEYLPLPNAKSTSPTSTTETNRPTPAVVCVVTLSPAAGADFLRHVQQQQHRSDAAAPSTASTPMDPLSVLTLLLHQYLAVTAVLDANLALQWTRHAAALEFCQAHRRQVNNNSSDKDSPDANVRHNDASKTTMSEHEQYEQQLLPSVALSSNRTRYWLPPDQQQQSTAKTVDLKHDDDSKTIRTHQALPLIAASCPAICCLVEKSHHAAVRHLSTVVSPMMAAAAFWKMAIRIAPTTPMDSHCHSLPQNQNQTNLVTDKTNDAYGNQSTSPIDSTNAAPSTIQSKQSATKSYFHLAVMPCHDKKLEASRKDFADAVVEELDGNTNQNATKAQASLVPRVDMVITTSELWQLLESACQEQNATLLQAYQDLASPQHRLEPVLLHRQEMRPEDVASFGQHFANDADNNNVLPRWKFDWHSPLIGGSLPTLFVLSSDRESCEGSASQNNAMSLTLNAHKHDMLRDDTVVSNSLFPWGSGGYADFIFRYAALELFGFDIDMQTADLWHPVANDDNDTNNADISPNVPTDRPSHPRPVVSARMSKRRREYYEAVLCQCYSTGSYFVPTMGKQSTSLADSVSSRVVLRFAVAYGMQTVQQALTKHIPSTLVPSNGNTANHSLLDERQQHRRRRWHFDYVEAMACPGSCLNGGGQLRVAERESPTETRSRIQATQKYFTHLQNNNNNNHISGGSSKVESDTATAATATTAALYVPPPQFPIHTRYHVVPPMQHSFGAAAGVAVADMVW